MQKINNWLTQWQGYFCSIYNSFLVEQGTNVNDRASDGKTIFHAAVSKEMELLVKYLIENGADMHVLDIEGKTPFDYASDDMVKAIELAMPKLGRKQNIVIITVGF
jgi:hypothetical protein